MSESLFIERKSSRPLSKEELEGLARKGWKLVSEKVRVIRYSFRK